MKILMSFKPEFVDKIITGEKRFEFRKFLPKCKDISTVIIYSTMPVGKVIGEFKVKEILSAEPESLWSKTQKYSGISKDFFERYFAGHKQAHAFVIESLTLYQFPLDIKDILPSGKAPQSFCYIK